MKITDIKTTLLSFPIPEDKRWRTDLGVATKSDNCLIHVETDNEITGVGIGFGNAEVVKSIVETQLKPSLVGENPLYVEGLWEKMYSGSRGKPSLSRGVSQPTFSRRGDTLCAIAGIDIALWDILGKFFEKPIYQILGASRNRVRGYASGGWAPGNKAGEEMAQYAAKGFSAVKMRAEGIDGFSYTKLRTRVGSARKALGPDIELMVDAHGSFDVSTAKRVAKILEEYDVDWFEEPVSYDDHIGQAEVRKSTSVPISSGESESTRYEILDLLRNRSVDIVQPDVAMSGGITENRRIASLASTYNIRYAPHVWGSGVTFAASIHLAMHAPNCFIFEVSQSNSPLNWELFVEPFEIKNGYVHAPDRPGLGFILREGLEKQYPFQKGPNYTY